MAGIVADLAIEDYVEALPENEATMRDIVDLRGTVWAAAIKVLERGVKCDIPESFFDDTNDELCDVIDKTVARYQRNEPTQ